MVRTRWQPAPPTGRVHGWHAVDRKRYFIHALKSFAHRLRVIAKQHGQKVLTPTRYLSEGAATSRFAATTDEPPAETAAAGLDIFDKNSFPPLAHPTSCKALRTADPSMRHQLLQTRQTV